MSITTRRKFLRAGTLVALSAALPLKSALLASGQQTYKGGNGLPGDRLTSQNPSDLLASYSKSTFSSYLNSIFRLHTGYSTVDVALVQVADMEPAIKGMSAGGECFSLVFVGGSVALAQGTYGVEHPALGSFQLFLVPGGPDKYGAQSYVAIINRLPYTWTLIDVPETRKAKTGATTTTTLQGTKPAETTAPSKTIVPTEPTPPRKLRPVKKRLRGVEEDFEGFSLDW